MSDADKNTDDAVGDNHSNAIGDTLTQLLLNNQINGISVVDVFKHLLHTRLLTVKAVHHAVAAFMTKPTPTAAGTNNDTAHPAAAAAATAPRTTTAPTATVNNAVTFNDAATVNNTATVNDAATGTTATTTE